MRLELLREIKSNLILIIRLYFSILFKYLKDCYRSGKIEDNSKKKKRMKRRNHLGLGQMQQNPSSCLPCPTLNIFPEFLLDPLKRCSDTRAGLHSFIICHERENHFLCLSSSTCSYYNLNFSFHCVSLEGFF